MPPLWRPIIRRREPSTLSRPSEETAGVAVVVEARDAPTTTREIQRDLGSGTSVIPKRM
jgi:hypothetical protein